ncbi:MAG TPA: alginate lyase family protein [Vicinamibacteria bacterium]|nr:alginate lyase family protein [Vicinamibacteria bacterium]
MRLSQIVRWGLRRPPRAVARRVAYELAAQAERFLAPRRARRFSREALLRATGAPDIDSLWRRLSERPYPAYTRPVSPEAYRDLCPGDEERILAAAEDARAHRVSLLGSGPVELGPRFDWSADFKSGVAWPRRFMRDIAYVNPDDASDVKVPWELSRLQWLIPCGQAYLLTRDERQAQAVRGVLEDWIAANPYAKSINWACAMEAALRILTWTWFFRVFHASPSWTDPLFRERFLCALYLHGDFTERHLEISDVNGNHCTADAAGLVFAELFFGPGRDAPRWGQRGWSILSQEIARQTSVDGVDFEGSVAYHRLVLELFLLPALYREAFDLEVPNEYRERVVEMARFSATYSRPDGSVPLWGDADDARALPLGGQSLNDHRYLSGLVGAAWGVPDLRESFGGSRSEILWLLGPSVAGSLSPTDGPLRSPPSRAFPEGGYYVLRNDRDHVFIDCGPVGFAGRGGHGHNDCLSLEAVLDRTHLVSDCGAYLYSASFAERNLFRSSASHNTPCVDGEEINRFRPEELWTLDYDARPEVRRFKTGTGADTFCGSHAGYRRLAPPVTPVRTIVLDHERHTLVIQDAFEGDGRHRITIPLHLAPGVAVRKEGQGLLLLEAGNKLFTLSWSPSEAWSLEVGEGRVSPSYGVALPVVRLVWSREGPLDQTLTVRLGPESPSP